jgi:hypothetical protein
MEAGVEFYLVASEHYELTLSLHPQAGSFVVFYESDQDHRACTLRRATNEQTAVGC